MTIRKHLVSIVKVFLTVASITLLTLLTGHSPAFANQNLQVSEIPAQIDEFQLVEDDQGWVLLGNQLFWSSDAGKSWENISPAGIHSIRNAHFTDPQNGFLVDEFFDLDNTIRFTLWVTTNQGQSWEPKPIDTFSVFDPQGSAGTVHLQFLDKNSGWVVLKQATSSNFSLGTVYRTLDGGRTWSSTAGPSGEQIFFFNQSIGFMVGGPRLDTLFRSTNGGSTWQTVDLNVDQIARIHLPNFMIPSIGHIAVIASSNSGTDLNILNTTDLGETWSHIAEYHLTDEAEKIPVLVNLSGAIQAFSANQIVTYWQTTGDLAGEPINFSDSLSDIMISGSGYGWALSNDYICTDPNDPATCKTESRLVSTQDSGKTWQTMNIPSVLVPIQVTEDSDNSGRAVDYHRDRTAVWQGQGFDQCEISTLSNLQSWKNNSPLSVVNLYFGGPVQACSNERLTPAFLETLSIQGWKFIPTWVGPQAACTTFSKKMSSNPGTARNQGIGQAMDAARNAMKFGLGAPDYSGTVIYYDLEGFDTTNDQCLAAAKAFIDGWVWQLHQYDITAGVYGSVCASGIKDFYTIDNPPDVIWPAVWSASRYNSGVTPDTLPCLADSYWGNRQRILQYTGPHNETWGNTSMYVDLNVIDGLVADISNFVGAPPTVLENGSFETGLIAPWEINADQFACDWSILNNSDNAQLGNYYLTINKDPVDTTCEGLSQSLIHSPIFGDRYRLAVWARSGQIGTLRALHLDLTEDGPSPQTTSQSFSGIGDDWVCLEMAHTISQNNSTGITASITVDDADGIDLLLDNAQLTLNTGKLCPTIPAPSNLKASDASDDRRIFLTWDTVPSATYYRVYRYTNRDPNEVLLDRAYSNQYIDTDNNAFTQFYYTVKACHAGGCSLSSNMDRGTIASPYFNLFDGFEDNNLNKWDYSINSPAYIGTCRSENLNGNYSLCIDAAMPSSSFLAKNLGTSVKNLEVIFKFDPNGANYQNYIYNLVKLIDTQASREPLTVQVRNAPSGYSIRISAQTNDGLQTSTTWIPIPDQPVEIMLSWWSTNGQLRSSAVLSGASLLLDGIQVAELPRLDNQQLTVDRIIVGGMVNSNPVGATGNYFIDDVSIWGPGLIRYIAP